MTQSSVVDLENCGKVVIHAITDVTFGLEGISFTIQDASLKKSDFNSYTTILHPVADIVSHLLCKRKKAFGNIHIKTVSTLK